MSPCALPVVDTNTYIYVNCPDPSAILKRLPCLQARRGHSDHQRIKLTPLEITVVDLKAGWVKSNFHRNRSDESRLPRRPIYEPMRAEAERAIHVEHLSGRMDLDV